MLGERLGVKGVLEGSLLRVGERERLGDEGENEGTLLGEMLGVKMAAAALNPEDSAANAVLAEAINKARSMLKELNTRCWVKI